MSHPVFPVIVPNKFPEGFVPLYSTRKSKAPPSIVIVVKSNSIKLPATSGQIVI